MKRRTPGSMEQVAFPQRGLIETGDSFARTHASTLKTLGGNVLLFALSLILTLFLSELLARAAFRQSMDYDMEMWKYASQIKVISDNPRAAYEHRPDSSAQLMGVEIATNSHGLRGPEKALVKPPNTYRILVLGDSITLGWGVPYEKTYPTQLERMLNDQPPSGLPDDLRYEVFNLGVGNYNTTQEIARLYDVGLQFDPDMILLGYFINDAEPTPRPKSGFLIENSYSYVFLVSRLRSLSLGNGGAAPNYANYNRSLYEESQPGWRMTQAALTELVNLGQVRQIPVAMFIIPDIHDLSETYPFTEIHGKVVALGTELGLPVVDLFGVFHGYAPEKTLWVSPADAHHNAKAQSMIARGISEALQQSNVAEMPPE